MCVTQILSENVKQAGGFIQFISEPNITGEFDFYGFDIKLQQLLSDDEFTHYVWKFCTFIDAKYSFSRIKVDFWHSQSQCLCCRCPRTTCHVRTKSSPRTSAVSPCQGRFTREKTSKGGEEGRLYSQTSRHLHLLSRDSINVEIQHIQ